MATLTFQNLPPAERDRLATVLETEFAQRDFRAAAVDRIARLPNLTEPGLPAEEIRAQAQRTVSTVLGMTGRFLTARNDR